MFVTDRLVFLQLRKTGCGQIARLLSEHVGGEQIGVHNRITDDLTSRFIVGSVRNPWDWYVSKWAFAFGAVKTGVLYKRLTEPPKTAHWLARRALRYVTRGVPTAGETLNEFIDSYRRPYKLWRSTYTHPEDIEAFRRWLRMVLDPARSKDLGEGYGRSSIHQLAGLYTYRYLWLFSRDERPVEDRGRFRSLGDLIEFDRGNNILDCVIRTENLEVDLIEAVERAGHVLSQGQKEELLHGKKPKTNKSKHFSTAQYYDGEAAALVSEKERFIIEKYGYSFPGQMPTIHVHRSVAAQ